MSECNPVLSKLKSVQKLIQSEEEEAEMPAVMLLFSLSLGALYIKIVQFLDVHTIF